MPDFDFYVQPVGADTDENLTRNTNESIDIAKGEAVQFRIDIKVPVRIQQYYYCLNLTESVYFQSTNQQSTQKNWLLFLFYVGFFRKQVGGEIPNAREHFWYNGSDGHHRDTRWCQLPVCGQSIVLRSRRGTSTQVLNIDRKIQEPKMITRMLLNLLHTEATYFKAKPLTKRSQKHKVHE